MIIFYAYFSVATVLASWLSFNMHNKLDQYGWHYHRLDFWLTLIFWPLIVVFRPRMLYRHTFKFYRPWGDPAQCTRQRISFMDSPPSCGSTITYLNFTGDGKELNAIFYFSAANVQAMAEHMLLEGMYGAVRWTSFRGESLARSG